MRLNFSTLLISVVCGNALTDEGPKRLRGLEKSIEHRRTQGYCEKLNALSPSDGSNCWEASEEGGCDNQACQQAVCDCDDYCCHKKWDLSCSGYITDNTDPLFKNNFFESGCAASILCCEEEVSAVNVPETYNSGGLNTPACHNEKWFAPADSTCWLYNEQPNDSPSSTVGDQIGCDYLPCQLQVCACDSYCCDVSWDLSCRGIPTNTLDAAEENYFHTGCSASILCCEPLEAPKPENWLPPQAVEGPCVCDVPPPQIDIMPVPLPQPVLPMPEPIVPECGIAGWYAPAYSTCWKYNEQPDNSATSTIGDQIGCDHDLCEQSVCACDSYCCEISWDLSCRGIPVSEFELENNYFVDGCSAAILCCEPEDAPKPDLPPNMIQVPPEAIQPPVIMPSPVSECGIAGWYAPAYSTCWKYNEQPDNSPTSTVGSQKGCDHDLCEQTVCACDSYCCDVSWDLSCRGIPVSDEELENNYFVGGCSAAILCCEPDEAPKPIVIAPPQAVEECDCPPVVLPAPEPILEEIVIIKPNPPAVVLPAPEPEPILDCGNGNWFAPATSSCWRYNAQPDGSPSSTVGNQKGCDHVLCEKRVCLCDPYCCEQSWDLSCRGIPTSEVSIENNYFVAGCSAAILCCEPDDAPKPDIPPEMIQVPLPIPPVVIVPEPPIIIDEPIPPVVIVPQPPVIIDEPPVVQPVPLPEPPVIIARPPPNEVDITIIVPKPPVRPQPDQTVIIVSGKKGYEPQGKSGGGKTGGADAILVSGKKGAYEPAGKSGGADVILVSGKKGAYEPATAGKSGGGKSGGGKTGGADAGKTGGSDTYYATGTGKKGYSRGNYQTLLSYLRGEDSSAP